MIKTTACSDYAVLKQFINHIILKISLWFGTLYNHGRMITNLKLVLDF